MTALTFSLFENKGVYALLLGSGLSRAAQIPTGWEITLDLARRVAAIEGVAEQSDWAAWHQERFGEAPDYSKLLDTLSVTPSERRSILHGYIEPAGEDFETEARQPTKAHRAIARLVRDGYIKVIVTTNFDRLLENALREAGVEPTVIKSEDDLAGAVPLIHSRCFILKLHGDYLDTRILNIDSELEAYGDGLNRCLDRIFDEHGLIICGWSGDWDPALRAAIARTPSRRYPTYWASRGEPTAIARDLIDHRAAKKLGIADADSFFEDLQKKIETLETVARPHPLTTDLLVGTAKRYLAKEEFRIQLADLVAAEMSRARKAADDRGLDATGQFSNERFIERAEIYEALYEPLVRFGLVMGRWGGDSEFGLATETLQALARRPVQNGLTVWLQMMTYPAALFFAAYALGAAKSGRLEILRRWLTIPLNRERWQEEDAAYSLLFGEHWEGSSKDLWNVFDPSHRWKTPFNDRLVRLFQGWRGSEFFEDADVEETFEWLEILVGVVMSCRSTDKNRLEEILSTTTGQMNFLWSLSGRITWHVENQERLLRRMTTDPMASALILASFAPDQEMLDLLDRNFRRVLDRARW